MKLEWRFRDGSDSTLVAFGSDGLGFVITADLPADAEEQQYTLHLPAGNYSGPILSRLMSDAQEIVDHHARQEEAA
jgi:hypothetical protein